MTDQTKTFSGFVSLSLNQLMLDSVIPFDIHVYSGTRPVLYRRADVPFTKASQQRLFQSKVKTVFVSKEDSDKLHDYFERNIREVMSSPNLKPEEKASLLYTTSTHVMEQMFETPDPELVPRIRRMVKVTEGFLAGGYSSMTALLSVASHDYYTYTHCIQVCMYSLSLGRRIGLSPYELDCLGQGAALHDIGKVNVNPEIIKKPGKLDENEWAEMKRHPVMALEILQDREDLPGEVFFIIRRHHEKLDGSGYPDGLRDEEIDVMSRIATIADIFDAITTNRSYSKARTRFEALEIMSKHLSQQLDQRLLREFVMLLGGR